MSKTTYNANVIPTYDTFATWLTKTNQIIYDMGNFVLTTSNTSNPDITSGNAFVNGYFGANTVYVTTALQGGTANTAAALSITSALTVSNTAAFTSNVTITGSANASVNVNAVGLLANNITANNNLIVSNTSTLNVATAVTANITTANVTTLGVTSLATVANATITSANVTNMTLTGLANIASANITTLYVSSLEGVANVTIAVANITNETITGTSNIATANITTLGVTGTATIATGVITTANITNETISGTSNIATANIATLGVTGNATIAIARVTTANITNETISGTSNIATANITTLGVTGSTTLTNLNIGTAVTANLQANTSTLLFNANTAANGTINATAYTGTAANATLFSGQSMATVNSAIVANASAAYANVLAGGYTITGAVTHNANVTLVGNTTASLIVGTAVDGFDANSTSFSVGNTTVNSLATSVTYTAQANIAGVSNTLLTKISNTSTLYIQTLNNINATANVTSTTMTVNSTAFQLVSNTLNANVSTAANNIVANTSGITFSNGSVTQATLVGNTYSGTANNATNLGGTTLATLQGQITGNAATAYSNAVANSANATNITSGTIGAGYLPSTIVNTSAAFTIAGVINHTANLVVTGNTTAVLVVGNNLTTNVTANATSLTVQSGATIGSVTANSTVITVGNATISTTINATSFSGTATQASNATNLNSQPASYYTNATNITTGTLPYAQLPSGLTNTSATFTAAGAWNWTANVVLTGNATAYLTVGNNNTSNITANATTLLVQGAAAVGSLLANSTVISVGNATVNATINSTAFSGLAANALYANNAGSLNGLTANLATVTDGYVVAYDATQSRLVLKNPSNISVALNANTITANLQLQAGSNGTAYVANVYSNSTVSAATFRANTVVLTVDSGAINLNSSVAVTGNLAIGTINATAIGLLANSTILTIGNSSVNTTINATSFSGTAANASLLGGTNLTTLQGQITGNAATAFSNAIANAASSAAALYQTTAGLSANVATLQANVASYLGNSQGTWANTLALIGNAYSNAIANAAANAASLYQTTAGLSANVLTLTANNANNLGGANASVYINTSAAFTVGGVLTFNSNIAFTGNSTSQVLVGTIAGGNGVAITNSGISVGNSTVNTTISATTFSGTANNATNFGGSTLATVQSQITGNAATAFSNAIANAASSAAALYQTTAGLSANVLTLTANVANYLGNSQGTWANTVALISNAYSNAVTNAASSAAALYQTTAGLSANVATLTANNANNLGGVAASAYINTSGAYTITGVHTYNANVILAGNATSTLVVGTAADGFEANSTVFGVGNATVYTAINATSFSGTANNSTYLGGSTLATVQNQITGNAATAFSNAIANAASNAAGIYQTMAGLSANVLTLQANVATYLGNSQGTWANTLALIATAYSNAIANAYSNAQSLYLLKAGGTVGGDLVVTGNLNVTGTTFYANVTNLDVKDLNITVAKGAASNAASDGAGITVDIPGATLTYSGTANTWNMNRGLAPSSNLAFDLGSSTLFWSNIYANTLNFTGGATINATAYSGTAANATLFAGQTLATTQSQISGNAASANTAAINYVSNGITNGTYSGTFTNLHATANLYLDTNSKYIIGSASDGSNVALAYITSTNNVYLGAGGAYGNIASVRIVTGANSGASIFMQPNNTVAAVFSANGNVGIGNNAPTTALSVSGDVTVTTGNVSAVGFSGNGALLTTLNATSITTGTIPAAQLPALGFANSTNGLGINGTATQASNAALLNSQNGAYYTNATNLSTGTVPTARLATGTANSTTILYGNSIWAAVNAATLNSQSASYYTNATNITTGTLPIAQIPSAVVNTSGNFTVAGNITFTGANTTINGVNIGYMDIPQRIITAANTLIANDAGQHLYYTGVGASVAVTVPNNTTLALRTGTAVTIINGGNTITVAAGTGTTLRLAGTTTTGTRTLANNAVATLIKVAAETWYISGSGIT